MPKNSIENDAPYSLIELDSIQIVPRPENGDEKLFFNPRNAASFEAESMAELEYAIRIDGLQQPPQVRIVNGKSGKSVVELIAGERRIRSCRNIYNKNLPCYDESKERSKSYKNGDVVIVKNRFGTVKSQKSDVVFISFDDHFGKEDRECKVDDILPTSTGKNVFQKIPCKVIKECSDERAIRLAFIENDQGLSLTISEEVSLVERLEKRGMKQEEISNLLGRNVTWVSQTANFRHQLPASAFGKLLDGSMSRHVAVQILSFPKSKRENLFTQIVEQEKIDTANKIEKHNENKVQLEDESELCSHDAKIAAQKGDQTKANKLLKKSRTLMNKAEREAEKLKRAKDDSGNLKQGHVKAAAIKNGIKPRKQKCLDSNQIREFFVEEASAIEDLIDPKSGESFPEIYLSIVKLTAQSILSGIPDFLHPIREAMYESGDWERPETEEEIEVVQKTNRRSYASEDEEIDDEDEEIDEIEMDYDEDFDDLDDDDLKDIEDIVERGRY